MVAISYLRGNLCEYINDKWVYLSDKAPIDNVRACTNCGKPPTPEGHDACLGYIEGAAWACCGHGIKESYIIWGKDESLQRLPEGKL